MTDTEIKNEFNIIKKKYKRIAFIHNSYEFKLLAINHVYDSFDSIDIAVIDKDFNETEYVLNIHMNRRASGTVKKRLSKFYVINAYASSIDIYNFELMLKDAE